MVVFLFYLLILERNQDKKSNHESKRFTKKVNKEGLVPHRIGAVLVQHNSVTCAPASGFALRGNFLTS